MSDNRGATQKWNDLMIFPVYHPAAALYNPNLKTKMLSDFEQIQNILNEVVLDNKLKQINLL